MFFVTILLEQVISWMRAQPGTTSLRALLYMDEVFGFFPPTAMPPSKLPLLTLMKQARAFGIGVVLATQNPVDLDYKGLGNAGTWFIGRLQTERDKARVIEGLLGSEAAGGLDRAGYEALMSNLTQRTFLMRNVHDDAPVLFRTRWALSYLRGPLTLTEIKRITDASTPSTSGAAAGAPAAAKPAGAATTSVPPAGTSGTRPVVQHGVTERFLARNGAPQAPHYTAHVGARVRTHYVDANAGLDTWQAAYYLAAATAGGPDWEQAEVIAGPGPDFAAQAASGATFGEPPAAVLSSRDHKRWSSALEDHVYRSVALELPACPALKMTATPGMTEGEFRARIGLVLREKRDAAVDAMRRKYAAKLATLEERERRAAQKVEREKSQASDKTISSALSVGGTLLGALFGGGRRGSAIRTASTAARSVSRASKERADVAQAEADARAVQEQIAALNKELEAEVARLESAFDPDAIPIETTPLKPRRADVAVEDMALVWVP
jgi:flagellar motility protein MotE (MotC chaperone)